MRQRRAACKATRESRYRRQYFVRIIRNFPRCDRHGRRDTGVLRTVLTDPWRLCAMRCPVRPVLISLAVIASLLLSIGGGSALAQVPSDLEAVEGAQSNGFVGAGVDRVSGTTTFTGTRSWVFSLTNRSGSPVTSPTVSVDSGYDPTLLYSVTSAGCPTPISSFPDRVHRTVAAEWSGLDAYPSERRRYHVYTRFRLGPDDDPSGHSSRRCTTESHHNPSSVRSEHRKLLRVYWGLLVIWG
jgi:hypothetical protein